MLCVQHTGCILPSGDTCFPTDFLTALGAVHTVNRQMIKLWSISVIFAVVLSGFASSSLFAQASALSLPSDPATTARNPTVQPLSTRQDQPSNQSQEHSVLPQNQNNGERASVSQTGIILGTVTDINDTPVPGAAVALQGPDPSDVRTFTTNENGFFEIRDVEPGRPYEVNIRAAGFSEWESTAITLEPGQFKILDVSKLQIEEVQTFVTVTPDSSDQIAVEQVKAEEKQRGFGIIPNFYAVYTSNPAPLTAKLRFSLALKLARDPFSLAGVALLAGVGQAANSPNYAQGAKGYGERFAENYANSYTDLMFDAVILPTLLHQDPRYFYQGAGTRESRAVHALSSLVITKGENGRLQPNYSSFGGDLASAAIAELYYPKSNRRVGLVFQGFAIDTAVHAAVRLLDEFVFRPSRTTPVRSARNNSKA